MLLQPMLQISIRSESPESLQTVNCRFRGTFYRLDTVSLYSHFTGTSILTCSIERCGVNEKRETERAVAMLRQPPARSTTTLARCNAYLSRGERTWPTATRSSRGGCMLNTSTHTHETNLHDTIRPLQTGAKLPDAHSCHSKAWQYMRETPRLLLRHRFDDDGGADPGRTPTPPRRQRPTSGHAGRAGLGVSQPPQRGRRVVQAKRRLRADPPGRSASVRTFPIHFSSLCK